MFTAASIPELISSRARDPALRNRIALQAAGATFTYAELLDRVEHIAGALLAHGMHRGERVALIAGRTADALAGFLGILAAGGAAYVVDPRLSSGSVGERLRGANLRWTLADAGHAGFAASVGAQSSVLLDEARSARPRTVTDLTPDDDALLVSTSGSTSAPKAVLLTHGNLLSNTHGVAERTGVTPADRLLHMLPLQHTNGVNNLLLVPLACGASIVLLERFRAETFFDEIAAYRPTYITGVATHYSRLLAHKPPRGALASLRFARSGAAPLAAQLQREVEQQLGVPLIHSYGLSEATCTVAMNPPAARKIGTVGTALAGQRVAVFAPSSEQPLPAGVEGEICITGPSLMKGYVPAVTAQDGPSIRNGWLRTGDLGQLDDEGYLTVTGRLKEIIIRGGENLSPGRIEEVILRDPAVHSCCVVGAPDDDLGEVPVAFVVARAGLMPQEKTVRERVAQELPRACVPARVRVLDSLPEIGIGKIDRKRLKQLAAKS